MPFLLAKLPPEVISSHLVPCLAAGDIVSLSYCLEFPITRQVYNRAFHDHTRFDHYDIEMFRSRARARLCYFGGPERDSPDRCIPPQDYYEVLNLGGKACLRMIKPYTFDSGDVPIEEVTVSGTWLHIRTSDGKVRSVILADRDGPHRPLSVTKLKARGKATSKGGKMAAVPAKSAAARSKQYINGPADPSRFVQMCSDEEFYGLDDAGLLWNWNKRGQTRVQGVPVLLLDKNKQPISDEIVRMRPSPAFQYCQILNRGIVQWQYGYYGEPTGFAATTSRQNGYPCHDGRFATVSPTLIPRTNRPIQDFVVFDCILMYLKPDGLVGAISINTDGIFAAVGDDEFVDMDVSAVNAKGPFVQICSTYLQCALVAEDGEVIVLSAYRQGASEERHIHIGDTPEISHLSIAHFAVGETHCLLLTKEGDVYTWGMEMDCNGCLGLGRLGDALKVEGTEEDQMFHGLFVDVATKIRLPGKAYAVYAHQDYSAILVDGE